MKAVFGFIFKIIFIVVLPFIGLIRGAVYFHSKHLFHPHLALLAGGIITLVVLVIYFSLGYGRLTGKLGNASSFKYRTILAACLVLGYCVHGLFFLQNKNTKTDQVQKEFTSLHPILRLSISTILFIDRKLILTDASRLPEDYQKMGLKRKTHSLHYKQKNGYAHAFDVRTKGYSEIRNNMIQWYFRLMGFNTLRHHGTEDHLHISLKSHDRPHAI